MNIIKNLLLISLISVSYLYSMRVENKTDRPLYGAIYYKPLLRGDFKKVGDAVSITPHGTTTINRPSFKIGHERRLVIAPAAAQLKQTLSLKTADQLIKSNIEPIHGNQFWIDYDKKNKRLSLYNQAEWKVLKPVQQTAELLTKKGQEALIATLREAASKHPYTDRTAQVRQSNVLSQDEMSFRQNRLNKTKPALEHLLSMKLTENDTPVVSFAISGGGFRAALSGIGLLKGAQDAGLLDASMYVTSLSGSTWFVGPWVAGGKSLDGIEQIFMNVVSKDILVPPFKPSDTKELVYELLTKTSFGQPVTIVDVWGGILARKILSFFGTDKQTVGFSLAQQYLKNGAYPLPFCTAVSDNISARTGDYQVFEFTPYEFGGGYAQAYIPIWAFGRQFKAGVSVDNAPEQPLAFNLGIWGSAFSVGIIDILDRVVIPEPQLQKLAAPLIEKLRADASEAHIKRLIPGGKVFNYTKDMASISGRSKTETYLELVDAGYAGGLPLVPLLRPERAIDIIVAFEISEEVKGSAGLEFSRKYAEKQGLRFPKITPQEISDSEKKTITVFGDPSDLQSLVIIYIPRILNKDLPQPYAELDLDREVGKFASSTKFEYSKKNADLIYGYGKHSLLYHKDTIIDVIKKRALAKQQRTTSKP